LKTQEEKLLDLRKENRETCVKCKKFLHFDKVFMDLETSKKVNKHAAEVLYCDECWPATVQEMTVVASGMLFKRNA